MVLIRPVITFHPISQSVAAGGSVTLSASAEGNPWPLVFRWRRNSGTFTNLVVHGTDAFLTLTNFQATVVTNQFHFTVAVTNFAGSSSLSSNAIITVLADTDGDRLPDEWELTNGFDPMNPSDALEDEDDDGVSNLQEHLAGTDPRNSASQLRIEHFRVSGSSAFGLGFLAGSNRTYSLQAREHFGPDQIWRSIREVVAAPTNRIVEVIEDFDGSNQWRFFRVTTPRVD